MEQGFCLAHQQMFGIALNTWLAEKLFGNKKGKKVKKIDDIELPGFMSISMKIWYVPLY